VAVAEARLPPAARSPARLTAWLTLVGLISVANFVGNAESGPPKDFVYQWSSAISELIYAVVLIAIVLAIAGLRDVRGMFALRRPRSWWRALGLGALLIMVTYVFVGALSPILQPGEEQGLTPNGWDSSRAAQFVVNFVAIAFVVPIVEELTFRGVGFTLLRRFGEAVAVVGVGVAFALVHGIPEGLPVFALFGGGLAYIRSRSESVYPGMVVHGLFNGLGLILAVVT
jgi:membrane protease YdiL (CAAX protease family)